MVLNHKTIPVRNVCSIQSMIPTASMLFSGTGKSLVRASFSYIGNLGIFFPAQGQFACLGVLKRPPRKE